MTEPTASAQNKRIVGRIGADTFTVPMRFMPSRPGGELVFIITANQRYTTTQTLKVLPERLSDATFRRVHRNALVNVDHIRKRSALSSQRLLITLNNIQEFIASKS